MTRMANNKPQLEKIIYYFFFFNENFELSVVCGI